MSISQLSATMHIDHAYELGAIAVASCGNIFVPIRHRRDIRVTAAGIEVYFPDRWGTVRANQIRFVQRHQGRSA